MSLSIPRAIEVVNKHLSDKCSESDNEFLRKYVKSQQELVPAKALKSTQENILPAFRETWRSGCNITAPTNSGMYFVSLDCIWRDRNRISEEEMGLAGDSKIARRAKEQLSLVDSKCCRCNENNVVSICTNLQSERDVDAVLVKASKDRAKLIRFCRDHCTHGALGMRESPYFHVGDVYGDIQRRLLNAHSRAVGTLKRHVNTRGDSLFGAVALRQLPEVRCKGGFSPRDNLFGSQHVWQ